MSASRLRDAKLYPDYVHRSDVYLFTEGANRMSADQRAMVDVFVNDLAPSLHLSVKRVDPLLTPDLVAVPGRRRPYGMIGAGKWPRESREDVAASEEFTDLSVKCVVTDAREIPYWIREFLEAAPDLQVMVLTTDPSLDRVGCGSRRFRPFLLRAGAAETGVGWEAVAHKLREAAQRAGSERGTRLRLKNSFLNAAGVYADSCDPLTVPTLQRDRPFTVEAYVG